MVSHLPRDKPAIQSTNLIITEKIMQGTNIHPPTLVSAMKKTQHLQWVFFTCFASDITVGIYWIFLSYPRCLLIFVEIIDTKIGDTDIGLLISLSPSPQPGEDDRRVEDILQLHHLRDLLHVFNTHKPPDRMCSSSLSPGNGAGVLSLQEFKAAMTEVLKTRRYESQLDTLFAKVHCLVPLIYMRHPGKVSPIICLFLSASPSLSFFLSFFLSLSHPLSLCIIHSRSLLTHSLSLCLTHSLSLCLTHSLSLSHPLSVSPILSPSVSPILFLSLSVSPILALPLCR